MEYRILAKDEIIEAGDEVDSSTGWNDNPVWVPATTCIGEPAPDPSYPAHRVYRRPAVTSVVVRTALAPSAQPLIAATKSERDSLPEAQSTGGNATIAGKSAQQPGETT